MIDGKIRYLHHRRFREKGLRSDAKISNGIRTVVLGPEWAQRGSAVGAEETCWCSSTRRPRGGADLRQRRPTSFFFVGGVAGSTRIKLTDNLLLKESKVRNVVGQLQRRARTIAAGRLRREIRQAVMADATTESEESSS